MDGQDRQDKASSAGRSFILSILFIHVKFFWLRLCRAVNLSMPDLAIRLSNQLGLPVVDKTGYQRSTIPGPR